MENLCHTHQTFWKELCCQTVVCIEIGQSFTQTIRQIYMKCWKTMYKLNITFKKMQMIWLTFIFQKQLHGNNYKTFWILSFHYKYSIAIFRKIFGIPRGSTLFLECIQLHSGVCVESHSFQHVIALDISNLRLRRNFQLVW